MRDECTDPNSSNAVLTTCRGKAGGRLRRAAAAVRETLPTRVGQGAPPPRNHRNHLTRRGSRAPLPMPAWRWWTETRIGPVRQSGCSVQIEGRGVSDQLRALARGRQSQRRYEPTATSAYPSRPPHTLRRPSLRLSPLLPPC